MHVHPTAIVARGARLGVGVEVGPYAIIGPDVVVGDRCRIGPHACLQGPLEIGEDTVVCFGAALGHEPQYRGRQPPFGGARIGRRNVFREYSQVHRSVEPGHWSVIGDDGYFMATSHVGHDCVVGNMVTLCNSALLAGHVEVGDRAFVSGGVAVHQFSRIGDLAMIGGNAAIHRDVAPYCTVVGDRPHGPSGLNVVGLRRAGVTGERMLALRSAYRALFRTEAPVNERIASIATRTPEVDRLVAFVRTSRRGIIGIGPPSRSDDES